MQLSMWNCIGGLLQGFQQGFTATLNNLEKLLATLSQK